VSSSPSADTLVPPDVVNAAPTVDFIFLAIQKATEAPLIAHAFKSHLRTIVPHIPPKALEHFFAEYVPATDTFSSLTVDLFRIVIANCAFSFNFIAPLFHLFCSALMNIGLALAQPVAELVAESCARESGPFAFPPVVKSLFATMTSLSTKVLTAHERLIVQTFSCCMAAVVSASVPLSPKFTKALERQLDGAMADFAFKSCPHFTEDIFTSMLELPDGVPAMLFPVVLKHLPNVKRVHRRVMLFGLVSRLLEMPHGVEILHSRGADFNRTVLALLAEDFAQNKDSEKRFMKGLLALNRWLTAVEKRRSVCACVNVGDFRRRLTTITGQAKEGIASQARLVLTVLQKIEGQVHPKQRSFT
jgi:hypothetical protein